MMIPPTTAPFLSAVAAEAAAADAQATAAMKAAAFALSKHVDHDAAIGALNGALEALKHPAQVAQAVVSQVIPGTPATTNGQPATDDQGKPIIIPDDPTWAAQVEVARPQARALRDYLNARFFELQSMRLRVVQDKSGLGPTAFGTTSFGPKTFGPGPGMISPGAAAIGPGQAPYAPEPEPERPGPGIGTIALGAGILYTAYRLFIRRS